MISDKNYIGIHLAALCRMIRIINGIYMENEVQKWTLKILEVISKNRATPSGCSLMVGGLG